MAQENNRQTQAHVPPHDLEAEKSVLGSLLIDADAIVKVVEFLKPKHFYKTSHEKIFDAILNLFERREPADLVTVPGELRNMKELEHSGGVAYLTELVNSERKEDMMYAFVPVLHLATQSKINLDQPEHFGEIYIKLQQN